MTESVEFAEESTKHPVVVVQIVHQMYPSTKNRYQNIRDSQIHDIIIGGGPHLFVSQDNDNNQGIANKRKENDHSVDIGFEYNLVERELLDLAYVRDVLVVKSVIEAIHGIIVVHIGLL